MKKLFDLNEKIDPRLERLADEVLKRPPEVMTKEKLKKIAEREVELGIEIDKAINEGKI